MMGGDLLDEAADREGGGESPRGSGGWRIERGIPFALIVFTIMQVGGACWYFSALQSQANALGTAQQQQQTQIAALQNKVDVLSTSEAATSASLTAIEGDVSRILNILESRK